jgi:endonuclease G
MLSQPFGLKTQGSTRFNRAMSFASGVHRIPEYLMPSNSPLDKLTPNQRIALAVAILVVAGVVFLINNRNKQPAPQPPGEQPQTLANRNVRFGMPAEAKADPASKDAYLMERPQYVLSYNDSKKIPNWVCWNLTASDIGHTERSAFGEDPELPRDFRRVKNSDYTGSSFDRGHMCPSKDRSDTEENNLPLFYMTNILPQAPNNNQQPWRLLEEKCRDLAKHGNELYIACGPHGRGGTGKDNVRHDHIGKGTQIEVPATVWKVVLVLPNKDATPTAETKAFAVWMPNEQSVSADWKQYIVSVSEVEKQTGFKFFPTVPDDVAGTIKSRVERNPRRRDGTMVKSRPPVEVVRCPRPNAC